MAQSKKVPKSVMKTLIKVTLLELLESGDKEILEALDEILSIKAKAIVESMSPKPSLENSKPQNGELFDRLVEVASGVKPEASYNGKKVRAPAKGVGFQGAEKIKKWATEAYTKLGGGWAPKGQQSLTESTTLSNQENLFLKNISEGIRGQDGEELTSMQEALADTAATTYQNFPKGHPSPGATPIEAYGAPASLEAAIVKEATPEQLFGEQAADGGWSKLAFFDEEK